MRPSDCPYGVNSYTGRCNSQPGAPRIRAFGSCSLFADCLLMSEDGPLHSPGQLGLGATIGLAIGIPVGVVALAVVVLVLRNKSSLQSTKRLQQEQQMQQETATPSARVEPRMATAPKLVSQEPHRQPVRLRCAAFSLTNRTISQDSVQLEMQSGQFNSVVVAPNGQFAPQSAAVAASPAAQYKVRCLVESFSVSFLLPG